ncbi:hypothetical protein GCM10027271_32860 [Saccharopolyspora gloriosae]
MAGFGGALRRCAETRPEYTSVRTRPKWSGGFIGGWSWHAVTDHADHVPVSSRVREPPVRATELVLASTTGRRAKEPRPNGSAAGSAHLNRRLRGRSR